MSMGCFSRVCFLCRAVTPSVMPLLPCPSRTHCCLTLSESEMIAQPVHPPSFLARLPRASEILDELVNLLKSRNVGGRVATAGSCPLLSCVMMRRRCLTHKHGHAMERRGAAQTVQHVHTARGQVVRRLDDATTDRRPACLASSVIHVRARGDGVLLARQLPPTGH